MGILLTVSAYAVLVIFLGISFTRFLALRRSAETVRRFSSPRAGTGPLLLLRTAGDIIFLTRLLKANDLLWIGELLFHWSFVLVVLRHLRFVLTPVPAWVWFIQPFGYVAGFVLPFSLLYILLVKAFGEKGYFPSYNFFLLTLLFLMSATGLLMRTVFRADIVNIKNFISGILTFSPPGSPDGILFIIHFSLALILVVSLPSHIFAAPFVIAEARRREEELEMVIHEK